MKWSDEPYVRVYTRDTTTWLLLSWQARAVLVFLMRKVDRSGQFEVDPDLRGLAKAIDMPLDVVQTAVTELVTTVTVVRDANLLTLPNFPEAQESRRPSTDAERAARYRERVKAARSAGNPSAPKTDPADERHEPSRQRHASRDASRFVPSASSAPLAPIAGGAGARGSGKAAADAHAAGASPPHPTPRATPIPAEWQPTDDVCAELEAELRVVTSGTLWERCVRAFVDWHRAATGRAAKSKDWNAKFRTWVRRDVTDDKLEVRARTMSEVEPTTSEPNAIELPADERKALADAARTALDLPKTGTEGGRA